MELIEINHDNIPKAKEYLSSIGKLQEFENKKIEPSQWSAVIQFANQEILESNGQNKQSRYNRVA